MNVQRRRRLADPPPTPVTVITQQIGDKFYIMGVELALTQALLPYQTPPGGVDVAATSDILVYADTVTLAGPLRNPGRGIQIVAREIVVGAGAAINTSGAPASPDTQAGVLPTQTDQSAGAAGVAGATGGTGGGGGGIVLYAVQLSPTASAQLSLDASGAKGGRGGDGHPGLAGAQGQFGVWQGPHNGASYDGAGGNGGDGGAAGDGGDGGSGGTITVGLVNGGAQAVSATAGAGIAGDAGAFGLPGAGGFPAAGLNPEGYYSFQGVPGRYPPWPNPGKSGQVGSVRLLTSFGYPDLAAATILPQLSMMQQQADTAFLGGQYATAAQLYALLMALTLGATQAAQPSSDQAARAAIYQASLCELSRLKQGLDFFGDRADWAPALTLTALQAEIAAMLTLASQMETSLAILAGEQAAADAKRQALQAAQAQASVSLQATQGGIGAIATQLATFEDSLGLQAAEIATQMQAITALQGELDEEMFAADHPGCTAMTALQSAGTVIAAGIAIDSGVGEIAAAGEALYAGGTIMNTVKNGIKLIKSVESTFSALQDGFNAVKGAIDPQAHPDGGKVITDEASYDTFIDQYVGKYAAAANLKTAVDRYFDLVKTRNANVLAFNALYLKQLRMQAEFDQQTAQFESMSAQLAAQNDPTNPAYTAFMQAADAQIRLYLLRKIDEERRAFLYWSVNDDGDTGGSPPADPTDTQLPTLQNTHAAIAEGISNWQDTTARPFGTLPGSQIAFTRAEFPDAFAALATTKRLIVRADIASAPAGFDNMTHVTATAVRVRLPDYDATQTSGMLEANVVHGGAGSFLQMDGETVVSFSHAIRPAYFAYDYASQTVIADGALGDAGQGYAGLSPFTDWIIDLHFDKNGANSFIDFDTISSVVLEFEGQFLGPTLR